MILDKTEQIMVGEGYAAASSRRIAQELKINAATVHYYFPTTDDMFAELHKRMIERQLAELQQVLDADEPLAAFWEYQSTWSQTALGVEFLALCNHRKALRELLCASTIVARETQVQALEKAISRSVASPSVLSPIALATILTAIGRLLGNEERVGITKGHQDVRAFVEWAIARLTEAPANESATEG